AYNLTIYHGKLYLDKQNPQRGFNLPVDIFLRSLADDQEKQAVAVILSGTGSDGTMGVKAIKEMGGMVIVQDEDTAKFDGMPRNAIATGLADYVLAPAKMGDALKTYIGHPLISPSTSAVQEFSSMHFDALGKILLILRESYNIDFSFYKENTIIRRIERRVGIKRFKTLGEYLGFLIGSEEEKQILCKDLLIGVTRFFRDAEAFNSLRRKILPQIIKQNETIRIWCAGCSTGEEVYSLAIECLEYMKKYSLQCDLKIFATDIDKKALEVASTGLYPSNIAADMEPNLLASYFTHQNEGYLISEDVRRLVVFAVHNVLKDPPFSRIDLISCRNLFIYFKADVQQQVLSMFYYSLVDKGYLFMGSSESIGEMGEAFKNVDLKWKLYQKNPEFKPSQPFSSLQMRTATMDTISIQSAIPVLGKGKAMERLLESALSVILPPSVIVDENDDIVHIINNMNQFLEIRPGRFSHNLVSNLPADLALFVNNILRRLKDGDSEVQFEHITGIQRFIDQKVNIVGRVIRLENKRFYQLSFQTEKDEEVSSVSESTSVAIEEQVGKRIVELEKSLQLTKENLQATVEELETSNEELQSSNEELIASNEELQSTNEELQAVNEELYSVNAEYQQKIDELIRTTNDLDNLIKNTEIGALYLDMNLCIRRVTPTVSKVANIFSSDIGRPISHFTFKNNALNLLDDIQHVLETLHHVEKEMTDLENKTWLVRIRPYRTSFNAVDGIIIILVDISKLKDQKRQNQLVQARVDEAMKIGSMAWWLWDIPKNNFEYDSMLVQMLNLDAHAQPYDFETFLDLVHKEDRVLLTEAFTDLRHSRLDTVNMKIRLLNANGSPLHFVCHASSSKDQGQRSPAKLFGTLVNVTKLKLLEDELAEQTEHFVSSTIWEPQFRILVDGQGLVQFISEDAASLWNRAVHHFHGKEFDTLFVTDASLGEYGPYAVLKESKQSAKRKYRLLAQGEKEPIVVMIQGFCTTSQNKQQMSLFIIEIPQRTMV
ncbi:MAG: hypothetical protein EOM15_03075, partial [Spirochaetia bacterium]|nr:hypothetical protein [Spirochaetia bacterium]